MDELVTKTLDAGLELVIVRRIPFRAVLAGYSVGASEGNVQHVVLVVAAVTVDRLSVACGGQGDRRLSNNGLLAVVAILVTPDTIDLTWLVGHSPYRWGLMFLTSLSPHTTAITLKGSMPCC